uniref:Uncharacterized protein n=1 Tax=Sus scrofa TaxID=9823 RepID=A0A4X1TYW0_PIG
MHTDGIVEILFGSLWLSFIWKPVYRNRWGDKFLCLQLLSSKSLFDLIFVLKEISVCPSISENT